MYDTPFLEMSGIHKAFWGVKALEGVHFQLHKGSVHALIGENGAGKSTLMKILTGVYQPDQGQILLDGNRIGLSDPIQARQHGISMIFQELSLVPSLSITENMFLGCEVYTSSGLLDLPRMQEEARKYLQKVGLNLDPRQRVAKLNTGHCQMVEIAKALSKQARILVLDEPTASLSGAETAILFDIIHKLQADGISMVYISHRMNEILQIADALTILRDGKLITGGAAANFSIEMIIENMIGSDTKGHFRWKDRKFFSNTTMLEVEALEISGTRESVSFQLREGEILGLAGLMGSGRTEILEALCGLRSVNSGKIILREKELKISCVADAIRSGIALVPEDRRRQGLILTHSVKQNLLLPLLDRLTKFLFLDRVTASRMTQKSIIDLNIKTSSPDKVVQLLSGGNQQKVVIAKCLKIAPEVLLLDEPTAGIDVGAKGEILEIIRQFADQGKSVIIVSSELQELIAICSRILVLKNHRIVEEIVHKEIDGEEVLQHAIQQ